MCVCVCSFISDQIEKMGNYIQGYYHIKYLHGSDFGVWFDEKGNPSLHDDSGWPDRGYYSDPIQHLYFQFDNEQREPNSLVYYKGHPNVPVYTEYTKGSGTATVFNYADGPTDKQPPTPTTTEEHSTQSPPPSLLAKQNCRE